MDEIRARRGGKRVGRGRLARLGQLLAERGRATGARARQAISDLVVELWARQDEASRADRADFRALSRIASGRHGQRLEKRMLGADAVELLRLGREKPPARLRDS